MQKNECLLYKQKQISSVEKPDLCHPVLDVKTKKYPMDLYITRFVCNFVLCLKLLMCLVIVLYTFII